MATKKTKAGRPPGPPEERRDYILRVALNQAERAAIESAAKANDAVVSTWVRELALKAASRTLAKEG